jgi:hypothetical protein
MHGLNAGKTKAHFTQGVKGQGSTQIKHYLLVQKLKSAPKGFYTRSLRLELGKFFSICPKLLINAELYGLVLAPRLKKDTNEFVKPI